MTDIALPGNFGKGFWSNYEDYWREEDAKWMQERAILRYTSAAARTTDYPTPTFGQVTYREDALGAGLDRLELYSKQFNAWTPLLMLANVISTQDNSAGVALSHKLASGKGIVFQPAQTVFDNPVNVTAALTALSANIGGGALTADATGVSIKTGTKTAKLTTTATDLVSDTPISAPGLTLTGGALTAGAVSATLSALTVNNVLTAGVNSGIAGVMFRSGAYLEAAAGYVSQAGYFRGDGNGPVISQRNTSSGAIGASSLTLNSADLFATGGNFYMNSTLLIRGGKAINYYDAGGNFRGYIAPNLYGADPGVGNVPDGTIWVS
jgi:hypothetical protein